MAEGSPELENLVLSNLSSPRFDISDFLKTPKDESPDEAYNLSGFSLRTPTFNSFSSLPSLISSTTSRCAEQEPDFGYLLLDAQGAESGSAFLSPSLPSEFISFSDVDADVATDPFALSSGSEYNIINDFASPISLSATYPSEGSSLPSFPSHNQFLGSDPGGQFDVEECVLPFVESGASTSAGSGSFFIASNQLDWTMPQEEIGFYPTNIVEHNTLQCDSCQLLRCIIHSNGVQDTKLEIHGRDGQSYHAVLQTRFCIDDGFPSTLEQQMVEFPVGNTEYVKQFLLQYSLLCRKEGFVLRHDSLQVHCDFGSGLNISSNRVIAGACIAEPTGGGL